MVNRIRRILTVIVMTIVLVVIVIVGEQGHTIAVAGVGIREVTTIAINYALLFCLYIMCLFCIYEEFTYSKLSHDDRVERHIYILLVAFVAFAMICTILCNIASFYKRDGQLMLFCTLRMLTYILLVGCYILYIRAQISKESRKEEQWWIKIIYGLFNAFTVIMVLIVCLNPWSGVMFSVHNGEVIEGHLAFLAPAFPIVVIATNALYVYVSENNKIRGRGAYVIVALIVLMGTITSSASESRAFLSVALFSSLIILYMRIHVQLRYENAERLNELSKAQQEIMLSQIQPHFVFNALNSIYQLCGEDVDAAREAIDDFSTYLRMNIDALRNVETVCLEEELRHVAIYTKMEKLRFGDRLQIEYDIKEYDVDVPPLSIQPLVENAIKHGVCARAEGGRVRVCSLRNGAYYRIEVSDNGVGFDVGAINDDGKTHIGIMNVKRRIESICNGVMTVESEPGRGTRIYIYIPAGL